MEDILSDYNLKICHIYLDDVIVFSRTYEEHMDRLRKVFQRISEAGLKLATKKCNFFQGKVVYVGHTVFSDGIEPDPEKTQAIRDWPTPRTPEDVRRFLGFAGYYRKFVKNFSRIASPLSELMPTPHRKQRKGKKPTSKKTWVWGPEQNNAFEQLRTALSPPPILGYADYGRPFELHTDAPVQGLGAILYQTQEGQKKVIAYASRSLGKAEKNYPAHKMEFLALKWAVTDKFQEYLYGTQFIVETDNNPLTYVLSSAKLDAMGHRWLAALAAFDFTIKYKPGAHNIDSDTLSRLPHSQAAQQGEDISSEALHTILSMAPSSAP